MIKTTMVDVILMVVTVAVKMLTKTFAPYANALKKKLLCQMVKSLVYLINILIASFYTTFYISCWLLL